MTPENTTKRAPELHMLGILGEGNDAYITGMESAGQRQLVASTSLPTESREGDEAYLKLGFTFGPADPSDPLFRPATLPQGWRKEASDHIAWSYVVDELGRRRVAVFYKAAFYDRKADMHLETLCSYARALAYDDALPVYDDVWCTREAFAAEVAAIRLELADRCAQARELADKGGDYWPGRARELDEELGKCNAWAARVRADG